MFAALPILLLAALGYCSSALLKRWIPQGALRALAGAALASATWVGGCYLLFLLTAPAELGPPLLGPLVHIFFTALAAAGVAVLVQGGAGDRRAAAGDERDPGRA